MNTRLLMPLITAFACTAGLGWKPAVKNQRRLSLTPVFLSDDERVWQLTIETREPTPYRIVSGGTWGSGELPGNMAETQPRRCGCKTTVWLVVSHLTPSSGDHAYLKTILKGDGGTVTQIREVPKGIELGGFIRETMTGEPQIHPMNTPAVIARLDGQDIRLLVGAAIEERKGVDQSRVGQ